MLKLSIKFVFVIIILILLFAFIVCKHMSYYVFNNYDNYLAAIIDKARALEKTKTEKIILLGGSNLAFGVNSKEISLYADRPVINLGLNADIGLNLIFKLSGKYISRGDIVICSPEYDFFYGDSFYGNMLLVDALYYIPEYINLMFDGKQLYSIVEKNIRRNNYLLRGFVRYLFTNVADQPIKDDVYYRGGFNEYGDLVSYLDKANRGFTVPNMKANYDYMFIEKLVEFKKQVESKGATFILAYQCIPKSQYKTDKVILNSIHKSLVNAKISQFITPDDFVFEDDCFFDNNYHLNARCRDSRTLKLINLIYRKTQIQSH